MDEVPLDLWATELRSGCRDPYVAEERQLETPRDRVAVDGGDQRLRDREPQIPTAGTPWGPLAIRAWLSMHLFQIGAGREGSSSCAGDDSHPNVRIFIDRSQRIGDLLIHRAAHGVQRR